jgi:hypothetical protein
MLGQMIVDVGVAFGDLLHEEDAAARRVGFEMLEPVCRTRLLAQAAARAAIEIGKLGPRRPLIPACLGHAGQIPAKKRPGSKVPLGSNAAFTLRISAMGASLGTGDRKLAARCGGAAR